MLIPSYQTTVVTDDGVSITTNADGSISKYYPDGKRVSEYPPPDERRKVTEVPQGWGPPERTVEFRNGTTKITKSGLDPTIWIYPNGTKITVDRLWFTDGMPHVKTINHSNGTEVYFKNGVEKYRVTTTKLPDGTEVKVYGDKTRSTKYPTGVTITEHPNGNTVISFPDGTYQINYKDGTVEKRSKDHETIERIEPTQESTPQEDLSSYVPQNPLIPDWFKSNAKWWKEGLISDAEIVSALENLIEQDIIPLERFTDQSSGLEHTSGVPKGGTFIPTYIKDVFAFWGDDLVSDNEITNSVGFLIGQGLISSDKIQQKRNEIIEASFSIYSDDEIIDGFREMKSTLSSQELQDMIALIDSKIKESHTVELSSTQITEFDRAKMALQLFGFKKTFDSFTIPGLDIEEEPIEYRTGSETTTVRKQPGLQKYTNLSLKIPRDDAKQVLFDFYEIYKWNELGVKLLEKSSELESEYVKTQLDDAWNDYSDTNDMQIQQKAFELESDYKKINAKLNDLDSLIDDIDAFEGTIISESNKLGIPILDLESAGKEPQSKIESDVKRGSSDFEKIHSQAEDAIRAGDKKTRILDELLWAGYSSGRYVTSILDKQTSDDSSFSSYYQLSDHLPVKADFIQERLHELQTPEVIPETKPEPTEETVEENQENSVSSSESSSQTEYQITVVEMDGKQFPITQFTIWKWEGECDSMWHYHTASSHATSLQSTIKNDPDPDNCGFGLVDYIPKNTVTITEDQVNQFKEITGVNPIGSEPIYGGEGP